MSDQPVAGIPSITSFEEFDVFNGKPELSRAEYKKATFTNSDTVTDARFEQKAKLLETTGAVIMADADGSETTTDKAMQATTLKESKEASV